MIWIDLVYLKFDPETPLTKVRDSDPPLPVGRLYGGICRKYEGAMKKNEGNKKKYEEVDGGISEKDVGNMR